MLLMLVHHNVTNVIPRHCIDGYGATVNGLKRGIPHVVLVIFHVIHECSDDDLVLEMLILQRRLPT